jgi:hypothetical protein
MSASPVHSKQESALAKVFEDKKKSRQILGQLWEENSRLEEQVKGNKKEHARLEVLVGFNKEELRHLEDLVNINRGKIIKASDESERLDKIVEKAVREKVEPPVLGKEDKVETLDTSESLDVTMKLRMKLELEKKITRSQERIVEGSRNLAAHEDIIEKMFERGITGEIYEARKKEVEKFKEIHRNCIAKLSPKIEMWQARLRKLADLDTGEGTEPSTSSSSTTVVRNTSTASKFSDRNISSSSKSNDDKKDDKVVEVLEEKKRKLAVKEKEKINPKVFKTEEENSESYPAYSCSHCPRHLSSAATLISHLEKHYPPGSPLSCPFPNCTFSSSEEGLTRHARSKHTGEKLFHCSMCTSKLPSYSALVHHEKKHSNEQVIQCNSCSRFRKRDGPGCHFCRN